MTQRGIIGRISLVTIASFLVLFLILFDVDPENAGMFGFLAFYASLFLSLWGLFFLAGFASMTLSKKADALTLYQSAFLGGLLTFLLVGLVALLQLGYFNFLSAIILSAVVMFTEFTFSKR